MIGGFFDDVSCPLFFHIFLALAKGNLIVTYFCSFTLACRQHASCMSIACHLHADSSRNAGESLKGSYLSKAP